MGIPIVFILFIILVILFQHHLRKNMRIEDKVSEEFWSKEQKSLIVRKKELVEENFIRPDISTLKLELPAGLNDGAQLQFKQIVQRIKSLAPLDMMNFSHMSNTELRIAFGTANQSIIETNEQHYNQFLKALGTYSHIMIDNDYTMEAMDALTLCIDIGSDYSDHFLTLAKLYKEKNLNEDLSNLIEKAKNLNSLTKKGLLENLRALSK